MTDLHLLRYFGKDQMFPQAEVGISSPRLALPHFRLIGCGYDKLHIINPKVGADARWPESAARKTSVCHQAAAAYTGGEALCCEGPPDWGGKSNLSRAKSLF